MHVCLLIVCACVWSFFNVYLCVCVCVCVCVLGGCFVCVCVCVRELHISITTTNKPYNFNAVFAVFCSGAGMQNGI